MAKKFSKMTLLFLGLGLLAILFFVFGMGRREGFYIVDKTTGEIQKCSDYSDLKSCMNQSVKDHLNCMWDSEQKKCMKPKE
jgi:hypothetical protein